MSNFIRKLGLIPLWITEFFHFCPLQRKKKTGDGLFLVIGHRGSPVKKIENTIESFETAMKEGANCLEVDLSITKDGYVVLWHDWDPDDTTAILRESGFEPFVSHKPHPPAIGNEYRKRVSQLYLEDFLLNFDYKHILSENSKPSGVKIPTLREFFEWSKEYDDLLYVFFDIKCPDDECDVSITIIDQINDLIEEYKPSFKVVMETASPAVFSIMKNNRNYFEYCLDIEPPAGIILDPSEYSSVQAAIDNNNKFAIALRPRKVTVANWTTYRRIMRHDIRLKNKFNRGNPDKKIESAICATISKTQELKCLVKMGVGGIQTDFPDKLYKIARKYGRNAGKSYKSREKPVTK